MNSPSSLEVVLSEPIAVMGFGTTGRSVLKWLQYRGVRSVKVIEEAWSPDRKEELLALGLGEAVCMGDPLLESVRTVVMSPGIFPMHPLREWCRATGRRLINDIQLWAWAVEPALPFTKAIGITGSNGKSTVTAWIEHVAKAAGYHAVAVGNIGVPILDVLGRIERGECLPVDLWVIELSSFQLNDCELLELSAATVLNISEDHLDYHGSMDEYRQAKARILQKARWRVVPDTETAMGASTVRFGTVHQAEWQLADRQLWSRGKCILQQSALPLLGSHNALNALAVLALLEGVGFEATSPENLSALCSFKGLPHRVERIAQFHGIDFIEDSKGTNVGSTVAALEGLGAQYSSLLLIAGGDGKGQDFSPLMEPIARFCREVLLIGRDAPNLADGLRAKGVPHRTFNSLESAVQTAFEQAQVGEAVVLSPACASWDMFRNYVHRAEVFTQTVHQCIEKASLC